MRKQAMTTEFCGEGVNMNSIKEASFRQIKAEVIQLTPELAEQLLKADAAARKLTKIDENKRNRKLKTRYVSKLVKALMRGEWKLNGTTICVSRSGLLLDGQHRCTAVVASGITILIILVTGLDDDVFATIDRGMGRSTSDVMSIQGEANSSALASITRRLHIYLQSGNPYHGNPDHHPTATQQLDLVKANPGLRDSASWVASARWVHKYMQPSLAGFCHFVFTSKDAQAARTFFAQLESGIGLDAGSPVLLLRNRLIDSYSSKEKLSTTYLAGLVFKAFRLHRDGATIKYLRIRTEGDHAEKDMFVL
jgi:hypothetical protein